MSRLLPVAKIAEAALQRIGAFTISMVAPDPDELSRTIFWMDLIVAELVGTGRAHWLIPATVTKTLTATTASYNLANFLGTDYPTDGILFPVQAYIRDSSGQDALIDIISRADYEALSDKAEAGEPTRIYIDRQNNQQQLYVHPVPADATTSLRLVFQKYAPDMNAGTPDGAGNIAHGFSAEWQRWLILQTAADIGSGPVRVIPLAESDRIKLEAQTAKEALFTSSNREIVTSPPVTEGSLF